METQALKDKIDHIKKEITESTKGQHFEKVAQLRDELHQLQKQLDKQTDN